MNFRKSSTCLLTFLGDFCISLFVFAPSPAGSKSGYMSSDWEERMWSYHTLSYVLATFHELPVRKDAVWSLYDLVWKPCMGWQHVSVLLHRHTPSEQCGEHTGWCWMFGGAGWKLVVRDFFAVAVSNLWNSSPVNIRTVWSIEDFKSLPKTHHFVFFFSNDK